MTLDASVPPGRDVRCIISVAMLSEGWDATTVTHVVGLRPFGSQLLCEQVVGRALRRTSYAVDEATGFFREETAKVFGVPFELIPFKVEGGAQPSPTPPANQIYAVPARAGYEITFPVVEGHSDPGVTRLAVDWPNVPTQMLGYAQRFLLSKRECHGSRAAQDVALNLYFQKAVGILFDALHPVDESGKNHERPVIAPGPAGERSTTRGVLYRAATVAGREVPPQRHGCGHAHLGAGSRDGAGCA